MQEAESTFDIILQNGRTGQQHIIPVKKDNQLWQIAAKYGGDLSLRPGSYWFVNTRLNRRASNPAVMVKQLLLEDGDKLVIFEI